MRRAGGSRAASLRLLCTKRTEPEGRESEEGGANLSEGDAWEEESCREEVEGLLLMAVVGMGMLSLPSLQAYICSVRALLHGAGGGPAPGREQAVAAAQQGQWHARKP